MHSCTYVALLDPTNRVVCALPVLSNDPNGTENSQSVLSSLRQPNHDHEVYSLQSDPILNGLHLASYLGYTGQMEGPRISGSLLVSYVVLVLSFVSTARIVCWSIANRTRCSAVSDAPIVHLKAVASARIASSLCLPIALTR